MEQPRIEVKLSATVSSDLYNTYDFYYFVNVQSDKPVNAKVVVQWGTNIDTVPLNGMNTRYFTMIKSNRVRADYDGTILGIICGDNKYHFNY